MMFKIFAKLDFPLRLVQCWQIFQISLVLLNPNCTRRRMITYTNKKILGNVEVISELWNQQQNKTVR